MPWCSSSVHQPNMFYLRFGLGMLLQVVGICHCATLLCSKLDVASPGLVGLAVVDAPGAAGLLVTLVRYVQ